MEKEFDYFLKNFSLFFDVNKDIIGYGVNQGNPVTIIKNVSDNFWSEKKDIDISDVIWKEWNGVKIPFLFNSNDLKAIVEYEDNRAIINYDIVAATFYFLSGWNEIPDIGKDELGRFKYENSIIKKLNLSNIPVVNYYFDILKVAVETVTREKIKKDLWSGKRFGAALTHDIDQCRSAWIEGSFSELKKKHLLSAIKLVFNHFFKKDNWFNFDTISEIEKEYSANSSFYFLPEKGKIGKMKNADYNIRSNSIQKVIKYLVSEGHEVGVHGSFGTHSDSKKFKAEISKVNTDNIVGTRFHFLMFDPVSTIDVLEKCEIGYDSTLGFAEQPGFRRGTCYPFYLYNFSKERASHIIEIPLIVMDTSLAHRKYQNLSREESFTKITGLIDEVGKFGGVFTILWHNTYFSDYKFTGWREVYIKILNYCNVNHGLLTSGESVFSRLKSGE